MLAVDEITLDEAYVAKSRHIKIQKATAADNAKLCSRAQQLIKQYGWLQGYSGDTVVGFCMSGALRAAVIEAGFLSAINPDVMNIVGRVVGTRSLSNWNDKPGRLKEEILLVLQEAEEGCWNVHSSGT